MRKIYIPIWLDLLSGSLILEETKGAYLHSNMVRFIILLASCNSMLQNKFTFQYG